MNAPLNLLHLANLNSANVGNGALIHGAERIIAEDLGRTVRWSREPWDDYTFEVRPFDREFVSLVNCSDGLIVCGAVAINGRAYLRHTGMRFNLPLELWPQLRKPVVFYGLSYRHWPYQPFHHRDKLKRAVDYALANPRMLFAVRNDGTGPWLTRLLGIRPEGMHIIPDPGLYVPAADEDYPELRSDRVNLILSLNDEDAVYRYGGWRRRMLWRLLEPVAGEKRLSALAPYLADAESRRRRILDGIVAAVQRLASQWDLNVILCPHYFDDFHMMADFVARCAPRFAHRHMVSTGLMRVPWAARFYGRYARADLVISMRVHSMSPAVGLGVPMVPLVTQDRMWAFLEDAGIEDCAVDAFDKDMPDRLYAAAAHALKNGDQVRRRFAAVTARFRERSRQFNLRMAAVLEV